MVWDSERRSRLRPLVIYEPTFNPGFYPSLTLYDCFAGYAYFGVGLPGERVRKSHLVVEGIVSWIEYFEWHDSLLPRRLAKK
jgi:hypothetical protein